MNPTQICNRHNALVELRRSLDGTLQDVQHYVVPFRGEFFQDLMSEHEQRWRRREIFDSTAVVSCNLLASQMQGTMTSPATKWFGLRFRDDTLNDDIIAKEWLEECEERCWQALIDSDFNTESGELYLDISSFGTSLMLMEEEDPLEWKGIDFTTMPLMDSYFEMDGKGKPCLVTRRLRFSTDALIDRWPEAKEHIKDGGKSDSDVEARHEVIFCIYKRPEYKDADVTKLIPPRERPFGYKYVLADAKETLEEGGYYEFPAMVVRWQTTAGSRWGYSPAMVTLSDIKQLNELVAQTSEARAKAIDPPYMTTQRGVIGDLDLEPGGLTMVMDMDELAPLINASRFEQADIEQERLQNAIRSAFYIDRLDLKESPQMTATEVNARREQMRRMMAPVVGRIQSDFLEPLIVNTFQMLARMGQLPEQPPAVAGAEMDIEYVGELARAQKADVGYGIEQWLTVVAGLSEVFPAAIDVVDIDEAIQQLAVLRGVPAKVIRDDATIQQLRDLRAEQEMALQQAQLAQEQGAGAQAIAEGAQALGGSVTAIGGGTGAGA